MKQSVNMMLKKNKHHQTSPDVPFWITDHQEKGRPAEPFLVAAFPKILEARYGKPATSCFHIDMIYKTVYFPIILLEATCFYWDHKSDTSGCYKCWSQMWGTRSM